MATASASPFADPDIDGAKKEMADRPSTFLTTQDLINRTVIIVPKSIEWKQGDRNQYESVTADIIVLDGRKTEKIPSLPHIEYGKFLGGTFLVAELRKFIPGSGAPEAGTPVLGVLVMDGKAYGLEKVGPDVAEALSTQEAWDRYQNPGKYEVQSNGKPQSAGPPF